MVRLLGPVDVVDSRGRPAEGARRDAVEFRAWATRADAQATLRGGSGITPRHRTNIASRARNMLRSLAGPAPDGGEWITRNGSRLRLHPLVVSDHEVLAGRVESDGLAGEPRTAHPAEGVRLLLRGVPFGGERWVWVDEEYLASALAVDAVEAVSEVAARQLRDGDPRAAVATVGVGLRSSPCTSA